MLCLASPPALRLPQPSQAARSMRRRRAPACRVRLSSAPRERAGGAEREKNLPCFAQPSLPPSLRRFARHAAVDEAARPVRRPCLTARRVSGCGSPRGGAVAAPSYQKKRGEQ